MYLTTSPTVLSFSASSSEISKPKRSSNVMMSSVKSKESAFRSSTNDFSKVTSFASTPSCSTTISMTSFSIAISFPFFIIKLHYHPTIYGQHLSCNVIRQWAGEKEGCICNIFRMPHPAHRDFFQNPLFLGIGKNFRHARINKPWRNTVHTHITGSQLLRQSLSKPDYSRFGSSIIDLTCISCQASDGGNIDNLSSSGLQHRPNQGLARVIYRFQVNFDYRIPLLFCHLHEKIIASDAGIVH